MPLVATFLYYRANTMIGDDEDALLPRLVPGLYISILGCISLYCVSFVVRHPHDVRTGDTKLREALQREDRKFRKAKKAKDRRRAIEERLGIGAASGADIWNSPVNSLWNSPVNSFSIGDGTAPYVPPPLS
ncbi:hypothetical protein MHU86_22058 [Fragilaria crotonensis]|nr:hypothetical protein MHU86_22058 [Fragilaria crotonensis]